MVSGVPLPPSITKVQFPNWTADGSRILAAASSSGFQGTQIVSFAPDGSRLRCLTCAVWSGPELLKMFPFEDGKRLLVRVGRQSPVIAADHAVLECAPSVLRCRRARVVPIVPPAAGDANVVQDQREFRVAPDGVHVAFTQPRRTAGGLVLGVGAVGRLVRRGGAYHVANARVVALDGELKNFTPDGRGVLFARFVGAFDAGNPDVLQIDLRSGRQRRATYGLDWDEDIDVSPGRHRGRRWMVVGSARGSELLEAVSQLRRPAAIDLGLSALPFAVFANRNAEIAEPWVVDRRGERAGRLGQPLAPGAIRRGWNSRPNFTWHPDGTAVVFWQYRVENEDRTRVVVARLPERRPRRGGRERPSPTPSWARPLAGYVPPDPDPPRSRRGRVSGRMRVNHEPALLPGSPHLIEVTYTNFADRRGFVIDGVERSLYETPSLYGGPSLYTARLTLSGRHRGFLRADDVAIATGSIGGTIESSVDGRRLSLGPLP